MGKEGGRTFSFLIIFYEEVIVMVADLIVGFGRKVKHEAIPFIKKKVEKEGYVYYLDIAIIFGVSATTARNWFLELARKNPDKYFYDSGYLYLKRNAKK